MIHCYLLNYNWNIEGQALDPHHLPKHPESRGELQHNDHAEEASQLLTCRIMPGYIILIFHWATFSQNILTLHISMLCKMSSERAGHCPPSAATSPDTSSSHFQHIIAAIISSIFTSVLHWECSGWHQAPPPAHMFILWIIKGTKLYFLCVYTPFVSLLRA